LAGCASSIPPAIRNAPVDAPTLAQLRTQADSMQGQAVRLGGFIVEVENRDAESWVTIVAQTLGDNGKPRISDQSNGRFIARIAGFVDPAVFAKNRRITVAGRLDTIIVKKIGDFDYRYALIDVDHYYLWPKQSKPHYQPSDPFWPYDPWYDSYDYFPYPYYYHRRGELKCHLKVCS